MGIEQSHEHLRLANEALKEMDGHIAAAIEGFEDAESRTAALGNALRRPGAIWALLSQANFAYDDGGDCANAIAPDLAKVLEYLERDDVRSHVPGAALGSAVLHLRGTQLTEATANITDMINETIVPGHGSVLEEMDRALAASHYLLIAAGPAFLLPLPKKSKAIQEKISTYLGEAT